MIFDRFERAERYLSLHPGFDAAVRHLRATNWGAQPLGRHTIDGERLFALVARDAGRGQAGAPLEAHRRYIDIQCVLEGADQMGWRPQDQCPSVQMPYSAERDIEFYSDPPSSWFAVPQGTFTIFYPSDAHAPLAGDGRPLKVVYKVAVQW
jgi:YhcH/YjgK/YiaL family protein